MGIDNSPDLNEIISQAAAAARPGEERRPMRTVVTSGNSVGKEFRAQLSPDPVAKLDERITNAEDAK